MGSICSQLALLHTSTTGYLVYWSMKVCSYYFCPMGPLKAACMCCQGLSGSGVGFIDSWPWLAALGPSVGIEPGVPIRVERH